MSKGLKKDGNDEVDELLKATEDELLLKLSVDSHMSRVSPSYIDPDLDARFQALKRKPSSSSSLINKKETAIIPKAAVGKEKTSQESNGDDLLARFAALKGSSGSSSSSVGIKLDGFDQEKSNPVDDKDEVDKLVQWAIDAARLDPSPPSDEDDGDDDEDEFDSDEEESDDEDALKKKSDKLKHRK